MFITIGKRNVPLTIAIVVAVSFGLLSIFSAGMVLFGPKIAQPAAGAYVDFVVWFNSFSGFAYVLAGYGMWQRKRWGGGQAVLITIAIAVVSVGFGMHLASGASYEIRTVAALGFRLGLWLAIASIAYLAIIRAR